MTEIDLLRVEHAIDLARKVGAARLEADMRVTDLLVKHAKCADPETARVLLDIARQVIAP